MIIKKKDLLCQRHPAADHLPLSSWIAIEPRGAEAHADHQTVLFQPGTSFQPFTRVWVNSTAPMVVCLKCGTIHRAAPGSIDTVC